MTYDKKRLKDLMEKKYATKKQGSLISNLAIEGQKLLASYSRLEGMGSMLSEPQDKEAEERERRTQEKIDRAIQATQEHAADIRTRRKSLQEERGKRSRFTRFPDIEQPDLGRLESESEQCGF